MALHETFIITLEITLKCKLNPQRPGLDLPKGVQLGPNLGSTWAKVALSWAQLEPKLKVGPKRSRWTPNWSHVMHMDVICNIAQLGILWRQLHTKLGPMETQHGEDCFKRMYPSLKPCEPQLGPKLLPNGFKLKPSCAILEPSWAEVGAKWVQVGLKFGFGRPVPGEYPSLLDYHAFVAGGFLQCWLSHYQTGSHSRLTTQIRSAQTWLCDQGSENGCYPLKRSQSATNRRKQVNANYKLQYKHTDSDRPLKQKKWILQNRESKLLCFLTCTHLTHQRILRGIDMLYQCQALRRMSKTCSKMWLDGKMFKMTTDLLYEYLRNFTAQGTHNWDLFQDMSFSCLPAARSLKSVKPLWHEYCRNH